MLCVSVRLRQMTSWSSDLAMPPQAASQCRSPWTDLSQSGRSRVALWRHVCRIRAKRPNLDIICHHGDHSLDMFGYLWTCLSMYRHVWTSWRTWVRSIVLSFDVSKVRCAFCRCFAPPCGVPCLAMELAFISIVFLQPSIPPYRSTIIHKICRNNLWYIYYDL